MNTSLSFRKESIQQSSSMSKALNNSSAGVKESNDTRHPGDRWEPISTTTTSLTFV